MKLHHVLTATYLLVFCPEVLATSNILKALYVDDFEAKTLDSSITYFKLNGEVGFLTSSGNTDTASAKIALDSEHELRAWSNRYRLETLYRESSANGRPREVSAQRFYSSGEFDFKLSNPDQRLFFFAEYDNNRFGSYDYQLAIAAGWAHRAVVRDKHNIRYSIGPGYGVAVRKDGEQDRQNQGFILRASIEYQHQLNSGAQLRQFVSAEANEFATRSRSETSLSTQIMESLAMKLSFILDYNSGVDKLNKSVDTETSIALVYQFF